MTRYYDEKTNTVTYTQADINDVVTFKNDISEKHNITFVNTDMSLFSFFDCQLDLTKLEGCKGNCNIKNSHINSLTIEKSVCSSILSIEDSSTIDELTFKYCPDHKIEIQKYNVKKINIVFFPVDEKDKNIIIKDLPILKEIEIKLSKGIYKLNISNSPKLNSIEISSENHVICEEITLKNFKTKNSIIDIKNLTIQNLFFEDCEYNRTTLKLSNCDIEKIKYDFISKWFNSIVNSENKETLWGYQKFKNASVKQSDLVSEQYFKAKEFEVRRKSLKPGLRFWKRDFWEKVMLFLNYISNFHGINWYQAAGISILFTVLMFWLYVHSSGYLCNHDLFPYEKFFNFYLPTHSTDFLVNKHGFLTALIDFIHRIFNSYFIYQLVAAFRRYGK